MVKFYSYKFIWVFGEKFASNKTAVWAVLRMSKKFIQIIYHMRELRG